MIAFISSLFLAISLLFTKYDEQHAVIPLWSDKVADSIGVNIHLHYRDTAYANWPAVEEHLRLLHIRHIRDGLIDTTWQPYYDHLNTLAADGIVSTLITPMNVSDITLRRYVQNVHGIEALEAPNEVATTTPQWNIHLQNVQRHLWNITHSISSHIHIIGPALTSADAYRQLGDLSSLEDFGNVHDYLGGHEPETAGWGDRAFHTYYGSLAYNLASARQASYTKAIISTENGYITDPNQPQGISEQLAAQYLSRMLLLHLGMGIPRTFIYELIDEGPNPSEQHFGLLDASFHPKATFTAIASLIHETEDPGPTFRPTLLHLKIHTAPSDRTFFIFPLEKRSGEIILCIWQQQNSRRGAPLSFSSSSRLRVSIKIPGFIAKRAKFHILSDSGALRDEVVRRDHAALVVEVDSHLAFLSFFTQKIPRKQYVYAENAKRLPSTTPHRR